ncbi:hypothetical protein D3C86_1238440 [compost metagenome]
MASNLAEISKPLLLIEPMFTIADALPTEGGVMLLSNKSLTFSLKYLNSVLILPLNKETSAPKLVSCFFSHLITGFP